MTQLETAHLAGITDGKVCFGLYRSTTTRYYPVIRVISVRPHLPNFLLKQTGIGTVKATPAKHIKGYIYTWEVLDKKGMRKFINTVMPYLKLKKAQAKLLLEYLNARESDISKEKKDVLFEHIHKTLRALKKRR